MEEEYDEYIGKMGVKISQPIPIGPKGLEEYSTKAVLIIILITILTLILIHVADTRITKFLNSTKTPIGYTGRQYLGYGYRTKSITKKDLNTKINTGNYKRIVIKTDSVHLIPIRR